MTTFSQIVDELATEMVRPGMHQILAGYLNQAMREVHFEVNTNQPVFFADSLHEAPLTVSGVTDTTPFLWTIPKAPLFQGIGAVWYHAYQVYARPRSPKINKLANPNAPADRFSYYRTGAQFAFSETGGNGALVSLCWFEYLPSLFYYDAVANRPVTYNLQNDTYTINPAYVGTAEQAMATSTNWLIQRHPDLLRESVRAKHYRRADDQFRSSVAYSSYKTLLNGMQAAESYDATTHYGS